MTEVLNTQENHQAQSEGAGHWLYENVVAPAYNVGVVAPAGAAEFVYNHAAKTVLGTLHINYDATIKAHPDEIKYEHAQFTKDPLAWTAQAAASFVGIVPYIIAGKAVGAGSRLVAESAGLEESAFGKFAASDRLTQIAGAGLYDFAKPTEGKGGLQERSANALGGMVSFSLFEFGNYKLNPADTLLSSAAKRFAWGAAGGSAGFATQGLVGHDHSVNTGDMLKAGLTGGLMNTALPTLQNAAADYIASPLDRLAGRGVPVARYIRQNGFEDNQTLVDLSNTKAARLTRVAEKNVENPYLKKGAFSTKAVLDESGDGTQKQFQLAHELQHRVNNSVLESQYKDAARYADPASTIHDPVKAKSEYIRIRRLDEARAQSTEVSAAHHAMGHNPDSPTFSPTVEAPLYQSKFDAFHEDKWNQEADQFVASGGTYRPSESYMQGGGGGGGAGGGRGGSADRYGDQSAENVFKPVNPADPNGAHYNRNTDEYWFPNKIPQTAEAKISLINGEKLDDVLMHYARKGKDPVTGKEIWTSERFLKKDFDILDGQYWGSVELNQLGILHDHYGFTYDRVERGFDGASIKYRITDGGKSPFSDGSTVTFYPERSVLNGGDGEDGINVPKLGRVQVEEAKTNGSKYYWNGGNKFAEDYGESEYGTEGIGTITEHAERPDGSEYFKTQEGGYLEKFKNPIRVTIPLARGARMPEEFAPNAPAMHSDTGPTYLVKFAFHAPDGTLQYQTTDDRYIYVQRSNGEVFVGMNAGGETRPIEISGPVSEKYPKKDYPKGKFVLTGDVLGQIEGSEVHPTFTRSFTSLGMTDFYEPAQTRTYGADSTERRVTSSAHFTDEIVDHSDDGAYHRFIVPRDNLLSEPVQALQVTDRGVAKGYFFDNKEKITWDLYGKPMPQVGQQIVEPYPTGLTTSLSELNRADGSPVMDGAIVNVIRDRSEGGSDSTWYMTNANEAFQVNHKVPGAPVLKHTLDANGDSVGTPEKLGVSQVVENHFRTTPFGDATSTRVGSGGSVLYTIANNHQYLNDVREYLSPKQIRTPTGPLEVLNVRHMKQTGLYEVVFADSGYKPLTITYDEAQQMLNF
ncbi:MAG TPA: hypothetical protein V6C81_20290 [Planktothrix sp.]|jgi:hypothetical protein